MKIQKSAEDYLETILVLSFKGEGVHSINIATALNFSKPSVSIAMKKLRENGYITVDGEDHIHLTESGREIAERVYERHRVLSSLLIHLGVNEDTAKEDACQIEHVISAESFEKIKEHALRHDPTLAKELK